MRLVSFGPPRAEQPGVLVDDASILPLAPLWHSLSLPPPTMTHVVGLLAHLRPSIDAAVNEATPDDLVPVESVRLGPPVPTPGRMVVCGLNYRPDSDAAGPGAPKNPLVLRSEVTGPNDTIQIPDFVTEVVSEAELVVVVGRQITAVAAADAMGAVAGYMCGQDLTSFGLFNDDVATNPSLVQPTRAKAIDSFCPTGPWLVTADAVADPHNLVIDAWVDDVHRQTGCSVDMFTDIPHLLAFITSTMTLYPGDLVFTGTPPEIDRPGPLPTPLVLGTTLRTSITGLGEMVNPVVARPADRQGLGGAE